MALVAEDLDADLVFCACGCGEPTNALALRALRLADAGMAYKEVALRLDIARTYVKKLVSDARRGKSGRYLRGHYRNDTTKPRKKCEFPPCEQMIPGFWRYCQDRGCQGDRLYVRHGWASLATIIERRNARGKEQATRLAERERAKADQAERRADNLMLDDYYRYVPLDRAIRHDARFTKHDVLAGSGDPADSADVYAIRSVHELREQIRALPIIPAEFARRLRDGEIRLLVDDDELAFVSPPRGGRDAVPWQDFPGPIPSAALMAPARMAHKGRSRKQKQKLARGKHSRPSRKPKVAR